MCSLWSVTPTCPPPTGSGSVTSGSGSAHCRLRRGGRHGLTEADRPLLNSLADAIAAVVAAAPTTDVLKVARDRLLMRKTRSVPGTSEIFDGLGPRLTSVVFKLDAISNHLNAGRPDTARVLADDAPG